MIELSPRQKEVCRLIVAGHRPREIKDELGISTRTVRFHLDEAARKIQKAHPHLSGSSRRIVCGYYVQVTAQQGVVRMQYTV